MFPFSVTQRLASEEQSPEVWAFEGSAYEAVTFDNEQINVFAAQVNFCEPHWHFAPELIYVLKGRFSITVNASTLELHQGGMLYVNPDQIHALVAIELDSELITVQFSPSLFSELHHPALITYYVESTRHYQSQDKSIKSTLLSLLEQTIHAGKVTPLYKMALIYQLLADLVSYGQVLEVPEQVFIREKDEALIKQSIEYINEHFGTELSLSAMAEQAGVSYSYFSKLFKRVSGYKFKVYLDTVRINKVKFLLKNTSMPITEISHRCGFTEHKHLISTFKRHCFMTPTAFRKHHLNDIKAPESKKAMVSFQCLRLSPDILAKMIDNV